MLKLNQLHSKDLKTIKLENIVGETDEIQTDVSEHCFNIEIGIFADEMDLKQGT